MDRSDNWRIYHVGTDNSSPGNYQLKLNNTNTRDSGTDVWNNTIPTATHFTLGNNAGVVANDEDFIAFVVILNARRLSLFKVTMGPVVRGKR